MKVILIAFLTSILTGCISGDPYPFQQGSAKIINGMVCIYADNATMTDKYIAFGVSEYPSWQKSENWEKIKPISAYNSCLPAYEYTPGVKYSVVYSLERKNKERVLYQIMFMINEKREINLID